jgi:hypothetical protein
MIIPPVTTEASRFAFVTMMFLGPVGALALTVMVTMMNGVPSVSVLKVAGPLTVTPGQRSNLSYSFDD